MLKNLLKKLFSFFVFVFKALFILLLLFIFFCVYFILGLISQAKKEIADVKDIRKKIPLQSSEFFSLDNKRIAKVFVENRYWISFNDIPYTVKNCLIASEDERFYYHKGVDFLAVLRSIIDILIHKEVTQGGSTITQQLARILFLSSELSIKRKIKEAIIARELENNFSKQEIMEMYLNLVYFGEGAYGIEAASRVYFGKSAKDLSYPEAALIIGLLPAPSLFSPYVDFKKAKERQLYVLRRLVELKYISTSQEEEYKNYPLKFKREDLDRQNILYHYYVDYVIQNFRKMTNIDYESLKTLGLKVYLNIDTKLQDAVQEIVKKEIDRNRSVYNVNQCAVILIENYTGRVLCFVGGYQFRINDQFNRAYQAYRQPGSVFKIVVYTAALLNGFSPDSIVYDKVYNYIGADGKVYSPKNWDNKYWGKMTLLDAFAFSRNTVAVYLANAVGIDKVIDTAYRMGVKTKLEPYLSTALGSSVITPLEVATFTSVIANWGYLIQPSFVDHVEDRYGGIIFSSQVVYNQVLPYEVAKDMRMLMKAVVDKGTGYSAKIDKISCYGKTGTTSDHRDAWFAGFTDDFTCVVWIGNDDYSPLNGVYGATLPANIWKQSIMAAYKYYGKPVNKSHEFMKKVSNNDTKRTRNTSFTSSYSTSNTTRTTTTTVNRTTTVDYNTFPWERTTEEDSN